MMIRLLNKMISLTWWALFKSDLAWGVLQLVIGYRTRQNGLISLLSVKFRSKPNSCLSFEGRPSVELKALPHYRPSEEPLILHASKGFARHKSLSPFSRHLLPSAFSDLTASCWSSASKTQQGRRGPLQWRGAQGCFLLPYRPRKPVSSKNSVVGRSEDVSTPHREKPLRHCHGLGPGVHGHGAAECVTIHKTNFLILPDWHRNATGLGSDSAQRPPAGLRAAGPGSAPGPAGHGLSDSDSEAAATARNGGGGGGVGPEARPSPYVTVQVHRR